MNRCSLLPIFNPSIVLPRFKLHRSYTGTSTLKNNTGSCPVLNLASSTTQLQCFLKACSVQLWSRCWIVSADTKCSRFQIIFLNLFATFNPGLNQTCMFRAQNSRKDHRDRRSRLGWRRWQCEYAGVRPCRPREGTIERQPVRADYAA
jgi:hypothetical protein